MLPKEVLEEGGGKIQCLVKHKVPLYSIPLSDFTMASSLTVHGLPNQLVG